MSRGLLPRLVAMMMATRRSVVSIPCAEGLTESAISMSSSVDDGREET